MPDISQRRETRIEWAAVIVFLAAQLIVGIWGASNMHTRMEYLEKQANKGDRFTADQGQNLAEAIYKVTESVGSLMIWRAEVSSHIDSHDKNSGFWIDTIQDNTDQVRELKEAFIRYRLNIDKHNENHKK